MYYEIATLGCASLAMMDAILRKISIFQSCVFHSFYLMARYFALLSMTLKTGHL